MNPRQRRGALLLIVAGVLGLGLVFALSAYVSDVQSQLGPRITQLQLARDVEFLEPITEAHLTTVEVPRRFAAEAALTDPAEVVGLVAAVDLPAGAVVQQGTVMPKPDIAPGEREVAVLLDPETGVGGKIRPGDIVDVYATFEAQPGPTPDAPPTPPTARVVLEAVRIVDIAPAITEAGDQFTGDAQVPVTFALTTQEALQMAYVESFAIEVRLGLREGSDLAELTPQERVYQGGGA